MATQILIGASLCSVGTLHVVEIRDRIISALSNSTGFKQLFLNDGLCSESKLCND